MGLPVDAESRLENITFKLTYQVNGENQIIGFFNRRSKLQPLRGLSLSTPEEAAHFQDSVNRPWKIEWARAISDRGFLNVQFADWLNFFPLYPTATRSKSVEGLPPGRVDLATGQRSGANEFYWERRLEKPQVSATLLYDVGRFGGNHYIKIGVESYRERRDVVRFQPTDVFYRDRNGLPSEVDLYNTPNQGTNDARHLSFHAQDSWTPADRLTLDLGLRYDRFRLGWPDQRIDPNLTAFFEPSSTPSTTVKIYNSVSPRLGLVLDVTGAGDKALKAFWGRFHFNPSIFHSDKENPVGNLRLRYRFDDLNGNRILDGPQELGDFLRSLDGAGFFRVDRDIEHAYGDELSLHFQRELAERMSFRSSYVYKNIRRGWGLVDVGRADAYTIPLEITDPLTGRPITLLDREPGAAEQVLFTNPARVGLPDYSADYHTVELALSRRVRGDWLLLTSFEYTWAKDFRENGQFSTSNLVLARHRVCGLGEFECDGLWTPNARRFGKMESTWWNYKLLARYMPGHGFGVSASYRLQSGFNFAPLINVDLPNAGTETIFGQPIRENRSDRVSILDLRVEKSFAMKVLPGRLTGVVDIFNLLNAGPVTNFRLVSGSRFKEVIALLDPRVVRFGLRYEFP